MSPAQRPLCRQDLLQVLPGLLLVGGEVGELWREGGREGGDGGREERARPAKLESCWPLSLKKHF